MQRSRRAVLAALPVALAGCGRSLRANTVPGGLHLRNRRTDAVTVSVRAAVLPPLRTAGEGPGGPTVTATPETPTDELLANPDASGEYEVPGDGERAVPNFFPRAGRWGVEAVVVGGGGDRTRILLHAAIPGPTGSDTLVVTIDDEDVTAEATTVD